MQYFEEASRIWREYVPKSGQSDTIQGELLRSVEKLRDEATRNGNMNWDAGFELLICFVESKLLDKKVYSEATIAATRATLVRLKDYDHPCLDDEQYDGLGDRVVEYFRYYGSQPHLKNPELHR
jgi:hypothetical protein